MKPKELKTNKLRSWDGNSSLFIRSVGLQIAGKSSSFRALAIRVSAWMQLNLSADSPRFFLGSYLAKTEDKRRNCEIKAVIHDLRTLEKERCVGN